MGNVKRHSGTDRITRKYIFCIWAVALLCCAYCSAFFIKYNSGSSDIRELRIQFADVVASAEKAVGSGEYAELDTPDIWQNSGKDADKNTYKCMIVGTDSMVLYSSTNLYAMGEKINLHALSTDVAGTDSKKVSQFLSPLIVNGVQQGTMVIVIEKTTGTQILEILGFVWPLLCMLGIILYCGIQLHSYIIKDVIKPVDSMSRLAKDILCGNYETSLSYDSSSEVGKLSHEMELLRDELHDSGIREKKLREDEKILLACISHDLKTPIATMRGCAEGIRDGIVRNENDIKRYVETIVTKSELLTKLINGIIENSRMETSEFTINCQEIYAKDYIKNVLESLTPDIEGGGLSLKADTVPDVLLSIDPDRIYQVFQNLIGNSIKYTPKGGTIQIEFEQHENMLFTAVTDNGQGIAAMDIPFVFDKFYRGEKARTQNTAGSGLGLSIVRNIVERHGGKVECDSEPGKKTTVWFSMPLV